MFSALIDTSAYEALRLSFEGDIFESLKKLSEEQKILIVGSDILMKEMDAHLNDKISQAVNKIVKTSKDIDRLVFGDLGALTNLLSDSTALKNNIKAERLRRITDFFQYVGYEEVDITNVNVSAIFQDYFNILPPFGDGNKRKEFPDAFILHAFVNQYQDNLNSTCIISQDDDWKKFAANYPAVHYFHTIAEFIDFINTEYNSAFMISLRDAIQNNLIQISDYLVDEISDGEFTIDDSWIDPEIELNSGSVDVEILEFNVISYESESAKVELKIAVEYDISLSASDETASYKDDDTRSWVYFGTNQYAASIKKIVYVEVELSFDPHPNVLADTIEIFDSRLPDEIFYIDDEQRIKIIKHWNDDDEEYEPF